MKAMIRKYVSLVIMLLLLVLIISWLPVEGTLETSYGYKDSKSGIQAVSLTAGDLAKQ